MAAWWDMDRADAESATLVSSFRACLASVTQTPEADLPADAGDFATSVGRWRSWLAGHGAGLVPIAGAERFSWPGYWIAVLDTADPAAARAAVVMFGTPAGVVFSPDDPRLLGSAAATLPVVAGYVVASLDAELRAAPPATPQRGVVEAVAIAQHATGPVELVPSARAHAGRGLEGDRYAAGAGTFTPRTPGGRGYDLTLIDAGVLDVLSLPGGTGLAYALARRNIVTRGIDVASLVGRRFRIGDVECLGQRPCEPCAHLEKLASPGVLRALIHRGGLRADILTDGLIARGDSIETID